MAGATGGKTATSCAQFHGRVWRPGKLRRGGWAGFARYVGRAVPQNRGLIRHKDIVSEGGEGGQENHGGSSGPPHSMLWIVRGAEAGGRGPGSELGRGGHVPPWAIATAGPPTQKLKLLAAGAGSRGRIRRPSPASSSKPDCSSGQPEDLAAFLAHLYEDEGGGGCCCARSKLRFFAVRRLRSPRYTPGCGPSQP